MGDPLVGSHALRRGLLTRAQLRRGYTRVFRDVYIPNGVELTPRIKALSAARFCGDGAVLVGLSAAAMFRTKWLDEEAPAEVVRPFFSAPPKGMVLRRYELDDDEITSIRGVLVTTPARTAFDIGRRPLPRRDAITILDALCRATKLKPEEIGAVADGRAASTGSGRCCPTSTAAPTHRRRRTCGCCSSTPVCRGWRRR